MLWSPGRQHSIPGLGSVEPGTCLLLPWLHCTHFCTSGHSMVAWPLRPNCLHTSSSMRNVLIPPLTPPCPQEYFIKYQTPSLHASSMCPTLLLQCVHWPPPIHPTAGVLHQVL